ncbi:NADH:ubiquinone oxidoreductase, subunit 1, conserved site-containing protein [Cynara cardunculus var. scolymus]|uniref:NADH:ubiquinone oxidoreductase, subunit 1, conserved site-containing protein n=1 Tax=Cynara cardunculus var. scolymus TaxID=59895 RepID=A0A103YJ21_CYNCS|nr:NADH:ubiquinone oxidoreductase, subunit 1, conserved site-containing protein [Cynara cardunculus var. scolymus]
MKLQYPQDYLHYWTSREISSNQTCNKLKRDLACDNLSSIIKCLRRNSSHDNERLYRRSLYQAFQLVTLLDTPFDLPEAEAESVIGYNVEYVWDAILNSSRYFMAPKNFGNTFSLQDAKDKTEKLGASRKGRVDNEEGNVPLSLLDDKSSLVRFLRLKRDLGKGPIKPQELSSKVFKDLRWQNDLGNSLDNLMYERSKNLAYKPTITYVEMCDTIRKPSNLTWKLGTIKIIESKVESLEVRKVEKGGVRSAKIDHHHPDLELQSVDLCSSSCNLPNRSPVTRNQGQKYNYRKQEPQQSLGQSIAQQSYHNSQSCSILRALLVWTSRLTLVLSMLSSGSPNSEYS